MRHTVCFSPAGGNSCPGEGAPAWDRGHLSLKRELRDGTVTPDGSAAGPGASEPRLFSHGKLKVAVLA